MLEMPALVALTATLFIYFKLNEEGAPAHRYMLVGFGLLATFFARPNYAIVLALSMMITQVSDTGVRPRNLLTRSNFHTVMPVGVMLGFWFAYPDKLRATWGVLVNQPYGVADPFSTSGLLFYPKAFFLLSGSLWISVAFLACLVAGVRRWADARIRLVVVLATIQFLICGIHHTKVNRYLLPMFPALFLLAGHFGSAWWNSAISRGDVLRCWAPRLAIGALALLSGTLPRAVSPPRGVPSPDDEAINSIASILRQPGNTLVLSSWELPCPFCQDWVLLTREGVLEITAAGSIAQIAQSKRLAEDLSRRSALRWLINLALSPAKRMYAKQNRTVYIGDWTPRSLGTLSEALARVDLDRAIVVTSPAQQHIMPRSRLAPVLDKAALKLVWSHNYVKGRKCCDVMLDLYRRF